MPDRQDSDREVLTSLPRTRPERRSAKRGDRPGASGAATATTKRAASAGKRTASATAKRAPAAATRTKSAAPKRATPGPAAAAKRRAQAGAEAPPVTPPRKVPPAGYAAPGSRADDVDNSAVVELVSTSIQAANELAQIGMAVGRQTLARMIERLPKP